MLECLRVRNFAIIDEQEVEFSRGLNVVTGETGAGKSILIGALQLVLGGRSRPETVRTGADAAEVEALFNLSGRPDVRARLEAADMDAGEELVLRRVVQRGGRSKAYVNGRMTSASQLAELARDLVDISSQHEQHSLLDADSHRSYLDAFGGLGPLCEQLGGLHVQLARTQHALTELSKSTRERLEREDLLRFQVNEISELDPQPGEEEALLAERDRQRHGERLALLSGAGEDALYASDDALCDALSRVAQTIDEAAGMDATLAPLAEQLWGAHAQLEDVARELGSYGRNVSVEPERLAEIEQRIDGLSRLKRKYGDDLGQVRAHLERAQAELAALDNSEGERKALEDALEAGLAKAGQLAERLSTKRQRAAKKLSAALQAELGALSMPHAVLTVQVAPLPVREGGLRVGDAGLSEHGIDAVEFLMAANQGEAPQPLRRIASGGELSRTMLAIKRVLGSLGPGGLYVFDEVDSGVGGAVADAIGSRIADVAGHHQVICITHLAQIAAFGGTHYHVRKGVERGRTHSHIDRLAETERLEEIARMLGGATVTDTTRAVAREMLSGAGAQPAADAAAGGGRAKPANKTARRGGRPRRAA